MQPKFHQPYPPKSHHIRKLSNGLAIPRYLLHPTKLAALAIVLLVIIFFNFEGPAAPAPRSRTSEDGYDSGRIKIPARAVGDQKGLSINPGSKTVLKEKKGGRIAIVTFTTEQKSYTHLSLKNHEHYARKHGYDFIVDYDQNNKRGAMWHKFDMIENAIHSKKYDWIWWMDFDTLITNTTIKVEDVINAELTNVTHPDSIDFMFTPDCFQLNAGSFFTRGHTRSIAFFDRVRAYHDANATQEHQLSEQDCMRDVMFPEGSNPLPVIPAATSTAAPTDPAATEQAEKQQQNQPGSYMESPTLYTETSRTTTWVPESEFAKHFLVIPQWRINAFPEEIRCWDQRDEPARGWERGTLAIHFAGAWAHVQVDDPTGMLMNKYSGHIIW